MGISNISRQNTIKVVTVFVWWLMLLNHSNAFAMGRQRTNQGQSVVLAMANALAGTDGTLQGLANKAGASATQNSLTATTTYYQKGQGVMTLPIVDKPNFPNHSYAPPTKIVFASNRDTDPQDPDGLETRCGDFLDANPAKNIWVINMDGTGSPPLTHGNYWCADHPVMSPNKNLVAFSAQRGFDLKINNAFENTINIWVSDLNGANQIPLTKLTTPSIECTRPAFSPDGKRVVYSCNRDLNPRIDGCNVINKNVGDIGKKNIWVVNVDGTGGKPLTRLLNADQDFPKWSPDGTKIAFVSNRNPDPKVDGPNKNFTRHPWVMNADGTGQEQLADLGVIAYWNYNSELTWSPDSTQIAFSGIEPPNGAPPWYNIWKVDVKPTAGRNLTNLTSLSHAHSFDPQWSPDGTKIAFTSNRDLNPMVDAMIGITPINIWVMNSDGTRAVPVTTLNHANTGAESDGVKWAPVNNMLVFDSTRNLNPMIDDVEGVLPTGDLVTNIWGVTLDGASRPITRLKHSQSGWLDL